MDIKVVSEELSIKYGFCSPESSLLMLYSIDQFLDNGILPPKGHPVHDQQRAADERMKRRKNKQKHGSTDCSYATNDRKMKIREIGGIKSKEQLKMVVELSKRLEQYFDTSPPKKAKENVAYNADLHRIRELERQ
eukprot:280055-Ditylum_brightwellii.AAC.1